MHFELEVLLHYHVPTDYQFSVLVKCQVRSHQNHVQENCHQKKYIYENPHRRLN
jgi:hypothetical protein